MLNVFVTEYLGTVAVGALVLLLIGSLAISLYRSKKRAGKSGGCGCGCGCSGCPMSAKCHAIPQNNEKTQQDQ